jgi:hypothetical protein
MSQHAALIFALLTRSAAADDYCGFKEAHADVPWLKSVTSIELCQKQVVDVVRQFGLIDAELRSSRWTTGTDLWAKDKKSHFDIGFGRDPSKQVSTIDIDTDSWRAREERLPTCSMPVLSCALSTNWMTMVWIAHDKQMIADVADRMHLLDYGCTALMSAQTKGVLEEALVSGRTWFPPEWNQADV